MYTLGNVFLDIADVHRRMDGAIWDAATDTFLPATPASQAAATAAVDAIVAAVIGVVPTPLSFGLLGNVAAPAVNAAVAKVVAALKTYAVATKK